MLVVFSLAAPALARARVGKASKGPTLAAAIDAKKPIARLDSRRETTVRAAPTLRPARLPPARFGDVPTPVRGALETGSAVVCERPTRDHPHQLRRIPRMNRGEPPRG
jgi:hypothetical protein